MHEILVLTVYLQCYTNTFGANIFANPHHMFWYINIHSSWHMSSSRSRCAKPATYIHTQKHAPIMDMERCLFKKRRPLRWGHHDCMRKFLQEKRPEEATLQGGKSTLALPIPHARRSTSSRNVARRCGQWSEAGSIQRASWSCVPTMACTSEYKRNG